MELVGEGTQTWHMPECLSVIKQHTETTDHDVHPKYVELKETGVNSLSQRWHSQADKNATNE